MNRRPFTSTMLIVFVLCSTGCWTVTARVQLSRAPTAEVCRNHDKGGNSLDNPCDDCSPYQCGSGKANCCYCPH